jgi:hypothetical protein
VRTWRSKLGLVALIAAATMAAQSSSYVVVLRGGEVISLKEPLVVRGSNAILTRTDGTVLSVPVSEIDQKATAARRAAPPPAQPAAVTPPPQTPAEAARANRERPRARVRITDADVGHQAASEAGEQSGSEKTVAAVTGAKLEVADYTQEKAGKQFTVRGSLRNVGATAATSIRLTVYLLNEKGEAISKRDAGLESTTVEPGHGSSFSAAFDVGEQNVAALRFQPVWIGAPPPPPVGATTSPVSSTAPSASSSPQGGSSSNSAAASSPPPPAPTPYGRGLLYAPSVPPASTVPPPDGKTGYIPGPARTEDQPKPPE